MSGAAGRCSRASLHALEYCRSGSLAHDRARDLPRELARRHRSRHGRAEPHDLDLVLLVYLPDLPPSTQDAHARSAPSGCEKLCGNLDAWHEEAQPETDPESSVVPA